MTDKKQISIILVDDQAIVRAAFKSLLERIPHFKVVGDAPDARRDPAATELLWKLCAQRSPELRRERVELANLQERLATLTEPQSTMVMAIAEKPRDTFILNRGDYAQPTEKVGPGTPAALPPPPAGATADRLGLAQWVVMRENPLTARVAVNRFWKLLFGTGLVATPMDFGAQGEWPSHPELLDWLATHFISGGWSAKQTIRLLVTSAAFRQSSAPNAAAAQIDADARLLWRFPPRRVEAEVLRDAALAVAGTLDLTMGGPGFRIHADKKRYEGWQVVDNAGPGTWRRMIYQENMRGIDDRMFTAFDRPDCGQVTPKRTASTTPLQAFNLFNGAFILTQADKLAERAQREAGA